MKKNVRIVAAIFLMVFGLLTLFLSSSILFDWFGLRAKEGDYVQFIVVTNFSCSFLYLVAAYGLFIKKAWVYQLLWIALILLVIGIVGLMVHIYSGNLYETRTVGAMIFRIVLTIGFLILAKKTLNQ
ncbi:MAG: hypothetical protein DWP94_08590 [Flavobacterium sp.]|nr:MAG: hypothetical protein DWP94_08590 [Flavobacterium sp.]